ncbi:hypothetical protein [uncultured Brevundimonas sp.]|uniref:hypothetical protein n=1 Tax=uncultured Brevundimonas sp. TaxID=213418 RepID=UPI0025D6B25B|nr:hypothetical protein [uncultured Brevundimonas sp.]
MTGFADISEMSPQLQLMIGTGSHLDPAELDPLIMLASLMVMQNAARADLDDDALTTLSLLLMVWARQLRDNPDNGGLVKTTAEDLADLSSWPVERVLTSVQALAPHILIDDVALFAEGDLEIGLAPLLRQDGADCGDMLIRYWTAHYVMRMAPKLEAAEETVAEGLARARDLGGVGERVAKLQVRWDTYQAQRDGFTHYTVAGAGADLAAFVDDVSTLEVLNDAVVGLIESANHGPLTFAQECGLLPCTKLQALAISAAELQLNPIETKGVRH